VKLNKSVGGNALIIDGTNHSNGIGTHSNSIIEYNIPEGYDHFKAKAGLDKECIDHPEGATVRFYIYTQDPAGPMPADSVKIPVKLEQLGMKGTCIVKDIWSDKTLGTYTKEFAPFIRRHSCGLYRISEKK
jgi:hypothetical protein